MAAQSDRSQPCVGELSTSLEDSVRLMEKATTFERPEICRATSSSRIMACGAEVLSGSAGTLETYASSEVCDEIDYLMSHNWSVGRRHKFLVLAFHFNFYHSVGFAVLGMLVGFAVNVSSGATTTDYEWGALGLDVPDDLHRYCTIAGMLCFFFGLFFGHEIAAKLGQPGPRVFLDKVCINQVDKEEMAAGIKALGAFLNASRSMLLVYTDMYLQKLWTVYEVATMITTNPDAPIIVRPTFVPKVVIASLAMATASSAGYASGYVGVVYVAFYILSFLVGRWWSARRRQMAEIAAEFDIRTAKCFVEADRKFVEGNVVDFMRAKRLVDVEATFEDCLDSFNNLARQQVPKALNASLGKVGIPVHYLLLIALPYIGFGLDFVAWTIRRGEPASRVLTRLAYYCALNVTFWPNRLGIMLKIASLPLGCAVVSAFAFFVLALMVEFVYLGVSAYAGKTLGLWAMAVWAWLIVMVETGVFYWLFRPQQIALRTTGNWPASQTMTSSSQCDMPDNTESLMPTDHAQTQKQADVQVGTLDTGSKQEPQQCQVLTQMQSRHAITCTAPKSLDEALSIMERGEHVQLDAANAEVSL